MKLFLDSSVLIESCIAASPKYGVADKLVNQPGSVTSAHALAEVYATLSGDPRLSIRPDDAARMVEDLANVLAIVPLDPASYRSLIMTAPAKGVRGGSIYDAIHAECARQSGCTEIRTLNVSHFKHVAPDLDVVGL